MRNEGFAARAFKPFVFIGSSSLPLAQGTAERLSRLLSRFSEPKPWWNDVFRPNYVTLQALWNAVQENDFGVFLFTPEATAEIREQKVQIANLNVLFEFGLFLGQLGPERVLLLVPSGGEIHLPNDLDPLTRIEYETENLEEASRQIERHLKQFFRAQALSEIDTFTASEARRHRSSQFKEQPDIRIEFWSRKVAIQPNGDAEIKDTLDGLRATGLGVKQLPLEIRSSAGRPADPIFKMLNSRGPAETVTWAWNDKAGKGPVYGGTAIFDPEIGSGDSITLVREYRVHNAFAWTMQDRLVNTNYKQSYEREFIELASAVDTLEVRVSFPEDRFPEHVNVVAGRELDDRNIEDLFETERVRKGLTKDQQARTITFLVHLPLAGYRYEIRWSLPRVDLRIPEFSRRLEGLVEEVNRRLLDKANLSTKSYEHLRRSLAEVRKQLASALGEPDIAFDCALFVYDRRAGGLRCAGSVRRGEPNDEIMHVLFRPGQGLAGRVFRSRSPLPYRRVNGLGDVNIHVCEPVDGKLPSGSILCLPLFLPEEQSRCVGVLSIDDLGGSTRLTRDVEDESVQGELKRVATNWYVQYFDEVTCIPSNVYWSATSGAGVTGKKTTSTRSKHRGAAG